MKIFPLNYLKSCFITVTTSKLLKYQMITALRDKFSIFFKFSIFIKNLFYYNHFNSALLKYSLTVQKLHNFTPNTSTYFLTIKECERKTERETESQTYFRINMVLLHENIVF